MSRYLISFNFVGNMSKSAYGGALLQKTVKMSKQI